MHHALQKRCHLFKLFITTRPSPDLAFNGIGLYGTILLTQHLCPCLLDIAPGVVTVPACDEPWRRLVIRAIRYALPAPRITTRDAKAGMLYADSRFFRKIFCFRIFNPEAGLIYCFILNGGHRIHISSIKLYLLPCLPLTSSTTPSRARLERYTFKSLLSLCKHLAMSRAEGARLLRSARCFIVSIILSSIVCCCSLPGVFTCA